MKMSLGSDGEVLCCLGTLSDADRDICVKLEGVTALPSSCG